MSLVQEYPLVQVKELQNPDDVFDTILGLIVRLAEHGLIHCDFNEFNIMIDVDEKITVIDFPQMVSVSHRNAQMFFDRDIECIYKFFNKRFNLTSEKNGEQAGSESDDEGSSRPSFLSVKKAAGSLDKELAASGFTRKEQVEMEKYIEEDAEGHDSSSDDDGDDEDVSDELDCNLASRESDVPGAFSEEHGTSCSSETRLEAPPSGGNGDAMEPLQSGGQVAELTKQLNKQRKKAIATAQGWRRPVSSRNAYKDKGKGTMNSKIQRQACKW